MSQLGQKRKFATLRRDVCFAPGYCCKRPSWVAIEIFQDK